MQIDCMKEVVSLGIRPRCLALGRVLISIDYTTITRE